MNRDAPVTRPRYLPLAEAGTRWLLDTSSSPESLASEQPADQHVEPGDAASDLALLPDLLDDTYARCERYRAAGLDLDELCARHVARIRHAPAAARTVAAVWVPVFRELRAAVPDVHLRPCIAGVDLSRDPALAVDEYRGPVERLGRAAAVRAAVPDTAAELTVVDSTAVGSVGSVSAIGVAAAAELAALGFHRVVDRSLERVSCSYRFDRVSDVGVVALPDFDVDRDEVRDGLERFRAETDDHRACSRLVVDLRGNAGGSWIAVYDWIRALRSRDALLDEFMDGAPGSGRQAAIRTWNHGVLAQPLAEHLAWAAEAVDAATSMRPLLPLADTMSGPAAGDGDADELTRGCSEHDWGGQVVALVDRRTGSSGELAAMALRHWLGATVVGERTRGALEGLDVLPYMLPNTGLMVRVPSIAASFTDVRTREGAGIAIDAALVDVRAPAAAVAQLAGIWR